VDRTDGIRILCCLACVSVLLAVFGALSHRWAAAASARVSKSPSALAESGGENTMPRQESAFRTAAVQILEAARRPMTVEEITEQAIQQDLLTPATKTPLASMAARLYLYVRDHPEGRLVRVQDAPSGRRRRGTVRWALRDFTDSSAKRTRARKSRA
jgi:hypothetical protein